MWKFTYIYRGATDAINPTVLDISFEVGTSLEGGDFDVTIPFSEYRFAYCEYELDGWIEDTNNGTIVAFGVARNTSISLEKETVKIEFSGIPNLLKGAILTREYSFDCIAGLTGRGRIDIKSSSKFGVLNNIINYVNNTAPTGTFLPFRWGGSEMTGSGYYYPLLYGDFKNLNDVFSNYIDNENVPAFKWTFDTYGTGHYQECSVNMARIPTQNTPLEIKTSAIKSISDIKFNSSSTCKICFAIGNYSVGSSGTQYTRQACVSSSHRQQNRRVGIVTNVTLEGTNAALTSDCALLTSKASNVADLYNSGTADVSLWQNSDSGLTFQPSNVGKIVHFPVILDTVRHIFGLVTNAKYSNNDTVQLSISNVVLTSDNSVSFDRITNQSATPKVVTNLLNTLSNNLNSQSVTPTVS